MGSQGLTEFLLEDKIFVVNTANKQSLNVLPFVYTTYEFQIGEFLRSHYDWWIFLPTATKKNNHSEDLTVRNMYIMYIDAFLCAC